MRLLAGEDASDFTAPPMPLYELADLKDLRVAFYTDNGFSRCTSRSRDAVRLCAEFLSANGAIIEELRLLVLRTRMNWNWRFSVRTAPEELTHI